MQYDDEKHLMIFTYWNMNVAMFIKYTLLCGYSLEENASRTYWVYIYINDHVVKLQFLIFLWHHRKTAHQHSVL